MSFSYANPTSGPSAGGIGWLNFGNLVLNPGDSITGLGGTLQDGSTVTFDLAYNYVSGQPRTFRAVSTPVFVGSPFGTIGYTGISGNVALWSDYNFSGPGTNTFTITNIVVKDSLNNPINNYTVVLADSETTNIDEVWNWNTNGGVWTYLALLGNFPPTIVGLGTQNVSISSNIPFPEVTQAAYVLTTQSPTQLFLSSLESTSGRQAFSIGFALTKVTLQKNIGQRIDTSDQFVLDITGTPSASATTSGNANGIQPTKATLYATNGTTYSIHESMAIGSASTLSDYIQTISASNATPAGSIPPVGNLPIHVTPILGDDITYTILNAAPEIFTKTVDKAYADIGDILTYSVTIENPNDFPINDVQFQDATPSGTIYIGNLTVSEPYSGSDPASGLTITSIAANASVLITWQVQVNMFPPIPNPIPNYANIIVPNGTSGMSNVVTTQVNTAFVSIIKMVDKAYASVNDTLMYTFTLQNSGNVPANNVIIHDILPSGTTFIQGSLIGASGTPPTLTLIGSIPSLGSATVQFLVKLDASLPSPNPVLNNASIQYSYTVNPQVPNGVTKTNESNQVATLVNEANVQIEKMVDMSYAGVHAILTYSFIVKNTGNVDATNVVLHDVLASGIHYISGSLLGASGTPANMVLNAPLPAGDTTMIRFQVQVEGSIPINNPIVNNAQAEYNFTINPMDPDGATGNTSSNDVTTQIQEAKLLIEKSVDKAYADVEDVLTYTLNIENIGNVAANNILLQDTLPNGTSFINGSLTGATGTPQTLSLTSSIAPESTQVVSFQVLIDPMVPNPNPLLNDALANYTYTIDPRNPDGANGTDSSNEVSTLVNTAKVTALKTVDKAYASIGDILTYTIALYNSGNTLASNVILHDVLPAGVSFVSGSLQGATGTPPTFHLNNAIAALGFAYVSFSVRVDAIPSNNQITNQADVSYTYTVNPQTPNDHHEDTPSNSVITHISQADVTIEKAVDKNISYIGDILTYTLALKNTGNTPANAVVLQDVLANGIQYVNNSLQASVPLTIAFPTITLGQPILPGQSVVINFKAKILSMPNPNPIKNMATLTYTFEKDPTQPQSSVQRNSNPVYTLVFRYPYPQQITDIIESVALQESALAALIDAEGAKIQKAVSLGTLTTHELLCVNKSVEELLSSMSLLEMILKQKVSIVDCQIDGGCEN